MLIIPEKIIYTDTGTFPWNCLFPFICKSVYQHRSSKSDPEKLQEISFYSYLIKPRGFPVRQINYSPLLSFFHGHLGVRKKIWKKEKGRICGNCIADASRLIPD